MSTTLKPAVRAEIELNSTASHWSTKPSGPSVLGLLCSTSHSASVPSSTSAAEPHTVSVVWIDQRVCRLRRFAHSSVMTGNPSPPNTMASISGTSTQPSVAWRMTLSDQVEKPALLKAETEWNAPCHSASRQPRPIVMAKRAASHSATTPSTSTVTTSTMRATERTSPSDSACVSDCNSSRVRSFMWPPISKPIRVAEVIMPKPPSWNSAITSPWPRALQ